MRQEPVGGRDRSGAEGPLELRYCETALRHGDPLRVHGLVLDVQRDPAGPPHVTLGTDQRVWLFVSNATDEDLVRLRAKARKWFRIGVGAIAAGLALAVTGVSIGASMAG